MALAPDGREVISNYMGGSNTRIYKERADLTSHRRTYTPGKLSKYRALMTRDGHYAVDVSATTMLTQLPLDHIPVLYHIAR